MEFDQIDVLVFDVYGTLLDVGSIESVAQGVCEGAVDLVAIWRAKQLEYSFIRTILDDYVDFWTLTRDALDYATKHAGLELDRAARDELLASWLDLRPFPDVAPAFEALRDRNLVVLSNGSPSMLEEVLTRSGLRPALQHVLSADEVQRFKPDPSVYALVPACLNVPPQRVLFFSSNGFDLAGAKRFGFRVCRVDRAGTPLDPLGIDADLTVSSLADLPPMLAGSE